MVFVFNFTFCFVHFLFSFFWLYLFVSHTFFWIYYVLHCLIVLLDLSDYTVLTTFMLYFFNASICKNDLMMMMAVISIIIRGTVVNIVILIVPFLLLPLHWWWWWWWGKSRKMDGWWAWINLIEEEVDMIWCSGNVMPKSHLVHRT